MTVRISVPVWLEITFDWLLIIFLSFVITFHSLRLLMQKQRSIAATRLKTPDKPDKLTKLFQYLSFGILIFGYLVPINRFFAISNVYGQSIESCSVYLGMAVLIASIHKLFFYQFILLRAKYLISQSMISNDNDNDKNENRLRLGFNIIYYLGSIIVILFESIFIIISFIESGNNSIGEFDNNNRCMFSTNYQQNYSTLWISFDITICCLCLFLYLVFLRKLSLNYENTEENDNITRIKIWSVIALGSTLIAGFLSGAVRGGYTLFLVADMVFNGFFVVMQFKPLIMRGAQGKCAKCMLFQVEVGRYCGCIQNVDAHVLQVVTISSSSGHKSFNKTYNTNTGTGNITATSMTSMTNNTSLEVASAQSREATSELPETMLTIESSPQVSAISSNHLQVHPPSYSIPSSVNNYSSSTPKSSKVRIIGKPNEIGGSDVELPDIPE